MTVNEKLQQLREQIANTPDKNDKKPLFIELLAYNEYARSNDGYEKDITAVNDLEGNWKKTITRNGIFDKLYEDLTDDKIIEHANDPEKFRSSINMANAKYLEDLQKAEEDKFFSTHEKIRKEEFDLRTKKNGWVIKKDSQMTRCLYSVATRSNDAKYVALYEKFLTTDVRDPAVRRQMLTELKDAYATIPKKPYSLGALYITAKDLDKKIKSNPSREEIDKAYKNYEEKEKGELEEAKKKAEEKALRQREAKEKAELGDILSKNGWPKAKTVADKFYTILIMPIHGKNEVIKTDGVKEFFDKLKSTKLEKGAEHKQMNAFIDEGIRLYEENTDELFKTYENKLAIKYLTDNVRSYDKEKIQLLNRLVKNGWKSSSIDVITDDLYDATHLKDKYVKDKKPLLAFYDKLWEKPLDKKFPATNMNALYKELSDTYKTVQADEEVPAAVRSVEERINVRAEKKEQQDYYGFKKIAPENIKGRKSKEEVIRRKAPGFEELVAKDDAERANKQLHEEQQIIDVRKDITGKLRTYSREIATAPSLFQRGHRDSGEITALKDRAAEIIDTVNGAQGDLRENEQFKKQLFEAYKAADKYKMTKRIEAKKDPYDKTYTPGSDMGKARWRAADIIIDLAKKYIGDTVSEYENFREEMNVTHEVTPVDAVVQKNIDAEYEKVKKDLLKINVSKNNVLRIDFDFEKASDNKTLVDKTARILSLHMVNSLYQTNAQAGVKNGFDKDEFLADVVFAKGEIENREDFKRMMDTNSPEDIVAAATANGGKLLIDKLAAAKKAIEAEAQFAQADANALGKDLENANEINNAGIIKNRGPVKSN